jgi:hypothetical protein
MIEYRPEAGQLPGTSQPAVPPAVRVAVRVMYAGAVASVIHAVVALATTGAMKAALEQKHPQWSPGTLSKLTTVTVIAIAVVALIAAVLFIWIARASMRGKNAARIAAAVLGAIGVLLPIYDVGIGRSTATLAWGFAVIAIGLASVVLLWLPSSGAYFRYFKRPQL